MKYDAFVSYSSTDSQWANKIKNALEDRGLNVWLDQEQIRPGDLVVESLEEGLDSSKSMILLVSLDSMESGWVKEEYSRAIALTKNKEFRLIPAVLRKA